MTLEEAVPPGAASTEWFGRYVKRLAASFFADDGIFALTWATCLQQAFDLLMDIFDRVGLHTNVAKVLSMEFQSCCALGVHSEEAYGIHMTGEFLSFQDRLR